MTDKLRDIITNLRDFAPAVYDRHDVQWLIEKVIRLRVQLREVKADGEELRQSYLTLKDEYDSLGGIEAERDAAIERGILLYQDVKSALITALTWREDYWAARHRLKEEIERTDEAEEALAQEMRENYP